MAAHSQSEFLFRWSRHAGAAFEEHAQNGARRQVFLAPLAVCAAPFALLAEDVENHDCLRRDVGRRFATFGRYR
jgi:hypothetical protein